MGEGAERPSGDIFIIILISIHSNHLCIVQGWRLDAAVPVYLDLERILRTSWGLLRASIWDAQMLC